MIITKFQNLKTIWTPGSNLAFPDILSRNVTVEEYQMHQLRYKRIPRDIEFFDERGTPVTYQIQHDEKPNDNCTDFYPIKYKRGNEEKIQSNTEFSSINPLSPSEDDAADSASLGDDSHHLSTDSEDDNIVCDISIQADQAQLCQSKQAHDLVLGKTDASLAKKCLTASDAPHLNTKALIQKLDEVAKTVDLDVSTILEEQMVDPVLGTVRFWIRKKTRLLILNHRKNNSLKVFFDIDKDSTEFL